MDGKIATYETQEVTVVAEVPHKPVILTKQLKADQGVLEAGSVIAEDADGNLVLYDPSNTDHKVVGVLTRTVDTGKNVNALVLVHGVVNGRFLRTASGGADGTTVKALEEKTIWTI